VDILWSRARPKKDVTRVYPSLLTFFDFESRSAARPNLGDGKRYEESKVGRVLGKV
jgi:hypothetical protein